MNKHAPRKSIIASFGALSGSQPESETTSGDISARPMQPVARVGAGVIGATQRTLTDIREERDRLLAQLAAGGGLELDPSLIDPSPFPDRLPDDTELDFEAFRKLIEEEGQKVPIQVRTHPSAAGRYQVVYGHRRWRAAKELARPVKAIVVSLTDSELVVAQGIENAARQDLTWIERALFAWRMDDAGIKARDIRAALAIDDPELARFRAVCRALPAEVLAAIGRAPKVGRPRWVELANAVESDPEALTKIHKTLAAAKVSADRSDDRFRHVLAAVKAKPVDERSDLQLLTPSGKTVGKAAFARGDIKLTIAREHADAFASFLKEEIPMMMERFFAHQGEA
ncbi:ParB family protein [Rhizobiales bacterium GAS113]|nr:ParB family protein [Rhizobiales bacterium GAS113]